MDPVTEASNDIPNDNVESKTMVEDGSASESVEVPVNVAESVDSAQQDASASPNKKPIPYEIEQGVSDDHSPVIEEPREQNEVSDSIPEPESNGRSQEELPNEEAEKVEEAKVIMEQPESKVIKPDPKLENEKDEKLEKVEVVAEVAESEVEPKLEPEVQSEIVPEVAPSEATSEHDSQVVPKPEEIAPEHPIVSHLNESITQNKVEPQADLGSENIGILSKPETDDIQPLSDDDIIIDGELSSDSKSESDTDSDSDSNSHSDSSSESDSESEPEDQKDLDYVDDDDEGETVTGPILSKNEVSEVAPKLPEDYVIPDNLPIELVGEVIGLVEQSMIIKANISGEFRVLKDQSVICFEDRTVVGPLFETFGRLQQPIYRVKFNTVEEFEKFKDCKGKQAYYVVSDSQFVYTDSIKHLKGTDASNCHDEELPEDEQEFSDDERELEAKQARKKKNKKNKDAKQNPDADKKDVRNNRKRQNQDRNENEPKKFQPYGYAQPSIPAVPQFPGRTAPVTPYPQIGNPERPAVYQYAPIHSAPGQPQLPPQPHQYVQQPVPAQNMQIPPQAVQQPLSSAYGVPYSQVQQSFSTTGHQTYNPYGQPYGNYNRPQFQQQGGYQGNPVFPPNQWNPAPQSFQQPPPQPPHPQQPHFQQPPQGYQQQGQLQPGQLEQLQQLIANQLQHPQAPQNFPPRPQ